MTNDGPALERRDRQMGAPGLWIGATACFLVASLAMVQIRRKIFGGFPSGDWPLDGYTWHFFPALGLCLAAWALGAHLWSRSNGRGLRDGMERLGVAAAPLLGLVVTWSWYGLTGPQFHAAHGCETPVLCHDVTPASVLIWSGPWVLWGGWRAWKMWRQSAPQLLPDRSARS